MSIFGNNRMQIRKKWLNQLKNFFNKHFKEYYLASFCWWIPSSCENHCTLMGIIAIEIDTLEYQHTEKIETELKDVDRIRAYRCTQLCPGCPSGVSHSHNIIYYFFPADSPPLRILYRITRQLLHRARCGSFNQKIETASWAKPANPECFILLCQLFFSRLSLAMPAKLNFFKTPASVRLVSSRTVSTSTGISGCYQQTQADSHAGSKVYIWNVFDYCFKVNLLRCGSKSAWINIQLAVLDQDPNPVDPIQEHGNWPKFTNLNLSFCFSKRLLWLSKYFFWPMR